VPAPPVRANAPPPEEQRPLRHRQYARRVRPVLKRGGTRLQSPLEALVPDNRDGDR
jgi:hypothetical protein